MDFCKKKCGKFFIGFWIIAENVTNKSSWILHSLFIKKSLHRWIQLMWNL